MPASTCSRFTNESGSTAAGSSGWKGPGSPQSASVTARLSSDLGGQASELLAGQPPVAAG